MLRTTTTRTEAALVAVERDRIAGLRPSGRISPRILVRGPVVRAALVPIQAGPLDGDHDRIHLHVGPDATLILVPIAATVALPGSSRIELEPTVEPGGRLVLDEPPLIVAEGADMVRRTRVELADEAVAVTKDVVVLGRAGEGPGRLDAALRVTLGGRPLLHDALRIEPAAPAARVALPPGHRVAGTACLLGIPGDDPAEALAGPGARHRATGADVPHVEAALAEPWARFSGTRGG